MFQKIRITASKLKLGESKILELHPENLKELKDIKRKSDFGCYSTFKIDFEAITDKVIKINVTRIENKHCAISRYFYGFEIDFDLMDYYYNEFVKINGANISKFDFIGYINDNLIN